MYVVGVWRCVLLFADVVVSVVAVVCGCCCGLMFAVAADCRWCFVGCCVSVLVVRCWLFVVCCCCCVLYAVVVVSSLLLCVVACCWLLYVIRCGALLCVVCCLVLVDSGVICCWRCVC